ncbi:MAG: efflux RND transporter periplasmic adaptor subunit [Bacteroidaceae bacterium]|nr:efflux RND transporter periplasmic adaptor subunit [Bacteroidaceae bacterium]
MKKILFLAMLLVFMGCEKHNHNESAEHHEHHHIHSFVAYTDNMELFLQHEGLEAGKKSCITLYATSLDDFKPAESDKAELLLSVAGKRASATANAMHKGVYHFDFAPEEAGHGVLYLDIAGEHAHFDVDVEHAHSEACDHNHSHDEHATHDHSHNHSAHGYTHAHSHAPHPGHGFAVEAKDGDVSFSKEQSWKIDFATAVAGKSSFDGVVKVAAKVDVLPDNFTTIVATTSGKVQFAGNILEGKEVAVDEPLFYLEGGDVTDNDAAVKYAEAESEYILSKADYERKKLLFIDKIVSEREYQAAEAAYRRAEARYTSMQRSFGNGKVCLRSPFAGYVAKLLVANGDYVQPGTPVARIERAGSVNISAELPVRYTAQLNNIRNVNIELQSGELVSLGDIDGRTVAIGRSVNECNMIPVTVTTDIVSGVVPGSIVTLYLSSENSAVENVVIPRSAIVEEMGSYFVFVQNTPVSFEKRSVVVGATDGHMVKVYSGVHAGERVVTKGAVVLKLSQGAAALDPHAGHVH